MDLENNVIFARLASQYLSDAERCVWTVEVDTCVEARTVANRYGLPADATTRRYRLRHVSEGWTLTARAAWRNNRAMEPLAVHVVIEDYDYIDPAMGDPDAACEAANLWLRSLPLCNMIVAASTGSGPGRQQTIQGPKSLDFLGRRDRQSYIAPPPVVRQKHPLTRVRPISETNGPPPIDSGRRRVAALHFKPHRHYEGRNTI